MRKTAHEEMREKVTAFFFNKRADVLRGEMYRALCLHVLAEVGEPCDEERIADLVHHALGGTVTAPGNLRTVVYKELRNLVHEGTLLSDAEKKYTIPPKAQLHLPDETGSQHLVETIQSELRRVAAELGAAPTSAEIERLQTYFFDACGQAAEHQLRFLMKGLGIKDSPGDIEQLAHILKRTGAHYRISEIIDPDKFITRVFLKPPATLATYIYNRIQVTVITNLLTWDPTLDFLHDKVLKGKTLYIDSSVLFTIMQKSNPLHRFIRSLLKATRDDLGVSLRIHAITLAEYKKVLEAANEEVPRSRQLLREIAAFCKRGSVRPEEYLETSIEVDYLSQHLDHIDLGTWHKYYSYHTGKGLTETIETLQIEVDSSEVYVPGDIFWRIKDSLRRASVTQFRKGRGKHEKEKFALEHDAKLFYRILQIRRKSDSGQMSLGYDTYLVTLDGSLAYFCQDYGLVWHDTYFMFPNQWYELAFPFLRLRVHENSELADGLASIVFSSAFPSLMALIPVELCKYVFGAGGGNLDPAPMRVVIEALVEERLVDSLDPEGEDSMKREEARLRVERLIAEEEAKQNRRLERLRREAELVQKHKETLEKEVDGLKGARLTIEKDLDRMGVAATDALDLKELLNEMQRSYDRIVENLSSEAQDRINLEKERAHEEIEAKERVLRRRESDIDQLSAQIDALTDEVKSMKSSEQEEKREQKRRAELRQLRSEKIGRIVALSLMTFGILLVIALTGLFKVPMAWVLGCIGVMIIGMLMYGGSRHKFALLPYALGCVTAAGTIMFKDLSEVVVWVIPMVWSGLLFLLDIFMRRRAASDV